MATTAPCTRDATRQSDTLPTAGNLLRQCGDAIVGGGVSLIQGRLFLPVVFLVGLLLRFWTMAHVDILSRDGFYYCIVARKIHDGHWLAAAQGWFIFNPYPPLIALTIWLTGWSVEFAGQLLCAVPSALSVIPLYFWTKSAFGRRVAVVTTLLGAFHPIIIRNSGEVMREGLYWFAMLTAVYFLWECVRRSSFWRAVVGGLFGTVAMLTRIEGLAIFPLVALWCAFDCLFTQTSRWQRIRVLAVGSVACAVLPVTLVLLNVTLLPPGSDWQGIGRFQHLAQLFLDQLDDSDEARNRRAKEREQEVDDGDGKFQLATFETFRVSPTTSFAPAPAVTPLGDITPSDSHEQGTTTEIKSPEDEMQARRIGAPRDVRDLAKSLPVWDKDCIADPVWYRLQRFLVMADDQAEAVYLGLFINRLIQGLLIPVLVLFYVGLRYGRRDYWQSTRDWPLLFQSLMLFGVFYFHLTTEHVLESRYLFCLIPFVFPWTAIGSLVALDRFRDFLHERGRTHLYPKLVTATFLLVLCGAVVHATPRNDIEKTVQREMGQHIRAHDGFGKKMVAPESLKRMAYYADAWFHMLPRQVSEIGPWLEENPMDFIVLGGKELPLYARLIPQLDAHPGYERIFTEDRRFRRYFIYRARALGKFSATQTVANHSD